MWIICWVGAGLLDSSLLAGIVGKTRPCGIFGKTRPHNSNTLRNALRNKPNPQQDGNCNPLLGIFNVDFSYWHLLAAWHLVRTRSNAAGIDGLTCELFAPVVEEQLHLLFRDLMHSRYFPKPAKGFHIPKKSGGHRSIGISTVRDRIVQRFLLQSLNPVIDEVFSDTCYAYRPGYSAGMAVAHLSEIYTAQPTWIVKADIEKFFDNLSWPLLLTDLERLQIAPVQVELVEQQLKAGIVISGRYFNPGKGVVQGNILSGALANLYLTEKVPATESIDVLFGYEGQGAHVYFQAFGSLLNEPFVFEKRTGRPPTDPVNSMMSLGYTLLHQNIFSLVQAVGLHPHFGNLHVPRKNHPALISDLIEEFRAPVVDSLVAYLVNSSILTLEDFTPPDGRGGCICSRML